MEIVTSWMEQGIEQGIERGSLQATRSLIKRLLPRRVGALTEPINTQIEGLSLTQLEALAEALLDFSDRADFERWLATQDAT